MDSFCGLQAKAEASLYIREGLVHPFWLAKKPAAGAVRIRPATQRATTCAGETLEPSDRDLAIRSAKAEVLKLTTLYGSAAALRGLSLDEIKAHTNELRKMTDRLSRAAEPTTARALTGGAVIGNPLGKNKSTNRGKPGKTAHEQHLLRQETERQEERDRGEKRKQDEAEAGSASQEVPSSQRKRGIANKCCGAHPNSCVVYSCGECGNSGHTVRACPNRTQEPVTLPPLGRLPLPVLDAGGAADMSDGADCEC